MKEDPAAACSGLGPRKALPHPDLALPMLQDRRPLQQVEGGSHLPPASPHTDCPGRMDCENANSPGLGAGSPARLVAGHPGWWPVTPSARCLLSEKVGHW